MKLLISLLFQENFERLRSRAVAYINLDDAVSGNFSFAAAGSPLLAKVLFQATKDVSSKNFFFRCIVRLIFQALNSELEVAEKNARTADARAADARAYYVATHEQDSSFDIKSCFVSLRWTVLIHNTAA